VSSRRTATAVVSAISDQGATHACRSVLEAFIAQVAAITDSGDGPGMLLLPLQKARASGEAVRMPPSEVIDNALAGLEMLRGAASRALSSAHGSSPLAVGPGRRGPVLTRHLLRNQFCR